MASMQRRKEEKLFVVKQYMPAVTKNK